MRKRKSLSQAQVAKLIGVNADTIDAYEYNTKKPSFDNLLELANVLGVSLDYLTGRTDDELELKNIQRIIDIQNMPEEFQKTAYYAIDAMIRVSKMEKVYAE